MEEERKSLLLLFHFLFKLPYGKTRPFLPSLFYLFLFIFPHWPVAYSPKRMVGLSLVPRRCDSARDKDLVIKTKRQKRKKVERRCLYFWHGIANRKIDASER